MSSDGSSAVAPSRGLRWGWRTLIAVIVVGAYVSVLVLFAGSIRLDVVAPEDEVPTRGVAVAIEVSGTDPAAATAAVTMQVIPNNSLLDDQLHLTEPIAVELLVLLPTAEQPTGRVERRVGLSAFTATYRPGQSAFGLIKRGSLTVDGNYQNYPFDAYAATLFATAKVGGKDVPVTLAILGDVPGWLIRDRPVDTEADADTAPADTAPADTDTADTADRSMASLQLVRAGSTKTFVLLLLAALLVLGGCALLVARAVALRRRRIEATMASWFAAMLFAVIPIRLNMPGSPPIGVWIDFLVLLWVELALMIGLAVFIGSWLRFTPAPDRAGNPPPGDSRNQQATTPGPE